MIFSTAKTLPFLSSKIKTRKAEAIAAVIIAPLVSGLCLGPVHAQHSPGIASITICSPTPPLPDSGKGNCDPGLFDTQQAVLGPAGVSVNNINNGLGVGAVPDEHSTVFAPRTLGPNKDYLFFLASQENGYPGIGVAVLSGGSGPDKNGTWTVDFPYADGYGAYTDKSGKVFFGQVFNHSTSANICPTVADKTKQDETFDMHYASAGSVVMDPTGPPGSVLMVYEGTNSCVGNGGTPGQPTGPIFGTDDDYISLAIATSVDYGKNWPTYRGTPTFDFYYMPAINPTQAPHAGMGAFGPDVCMGNDCTTTAPASYGRYAVVTPPKSLHSFMMNGMTIGMKFGEQEISGFVDDVGGNKMPYLYANSGDVRVARAQLNGGTAPLVFWKWNGTDFRSTPGDPLSWQGLGGTEISVLPQGAFTNCEDPSQNRFGSSISYVDSTQQYLLTFVCISPGNPKDGPDPKITKPNGAAWFYSTSYDLSDQSWSTPSEIQGSWNTYDTMNPCANGGDGNFNGWYPSFMSLDKKPGHLSMTGYVFYLTGCQGGTPSGRTFSSRAFTITKVVPPEN